MRKATFEPPHQQPICKEVATIEAVDADAIRDACISQETRKKYTGSINGIKKWIKLELAKADSDTARFFDVTGDIDLEKFTPEWFDKFLDEAHAVELFNCGYIMLKFRPSKRERRSTQIKLTTALRFAKQTEAPHVHTSLSPGSDKQLVVIQVAVLP
ncbi:hypothetical protein PHMEG_00024023 [Phytophthora megakarya]|uniref:Uncharacterized protein n=1 Tax=Phytophthora megakarya TaxID=4795 RepID=A0A225VEP7_9STRA|nr:hypothetical protein PHMEG_00024023 [Phytophthora megakarya]